MISSESHNILLPNLVWWCCRRSESVTRNKNSLLSSRSRSQRGLILSKYYFDYYIFWTANSLATRRGLMIGYHKPERLVEKLDYCIQGQGHSDGSKCRYLSRWYFLNRRPNILLPNSVLWCIIMGWSVMQKDLFAIFKVKVTATALMIKIWQFYCIFWIADPFATKLGLMVHYRKPECLMKKLDCCVQGQGHGKIAKCQWLFIQMLSSELLILILPNLVQ